MVSTLISTHETEEYRSGTQMPIRTLWTENFSITQMRSGQNHAVLRGQMDKKVRSQVTYAIMDELLVVISASISRKLSWGLVPFNDGGSGYFVVG